MGETPRAFLVKRAIRVVPLYWAATLLLCAVSYLDVFTHFSFDARRLALSLLFIPYRETTGDPGPLLIVGWTLEIEMLFYAIFAVSLAIGRPIGVSLAVLSLFALVGGLCDVSSAILAQWTTPLLVEFAGGLLLATLVRPSGLRMGLAMIGLALAWFAGLGALGIFDQSFRLLTWGLPAFLLVGGALAIERAGRWPAALRPLERGGDASYSLYLLHGFVISVVQAILGTGLPAKAATLVLAILVAAAAHRLFEKPVGAALGRMLRPLLRLRDRPAAALATPREAKAEP